MQHNKSKGFRSFVKEKGYYIVLLLCAATVGVSGYFLLSNKEVPQETPVVATDPPTTAPSEPTRETSPTEPSAPSTQTPSVRRTRPVSGELLTAFAADHLAYNETTRDWRTHEGIDLCADVGEAVVAAADGTVHAIYEDDSLGITVVLTHDDGYTTRYANLAEELSVGVGDTVTAGTQLGTVGQTANIETAAAPHLHFAVYRNDAPVDPSDFLAQSSE